MWQDANYSMMPDKINDLALGPCGIGADGEMNAVLACGDRCVRVLNASEVAYEASTPPTRGPSQHHHASCERALCSRHTGMGWCVRCVGAVG